jgi:hypothetical protein
MVDRVYKAAIPELRTSLERLKQEFSHLSPTKNWTRLRIQPLLTHARELERLLKAERSARLTKGVSMFHSDLVYLRDNVRALERILESEKKALQRGKKTK